MTIKLIVYDFDGVLTDNRVWVFQDGTEAVACNRSDGWYIKEIRNLGIEQFILSTEKNPVVKVRAEKLRLPFSQDVEDKGLELDVLMGKKGLSRDQVAYVGNEMNDWECFMRVRYGLAPKDSHPKIRSHAAYVIPCDGGHGIVRHVYEWLLVNNLAEEVA